MDIPGTSFGIIWTLPTCTDRASLGETFWVLKEINKYGENRTRRFVLETWDKL